MNSMRQDARLIYTAAIAASMPDTAVRQCLEQIQFGSGKIVVIAIGKAAWPMADAAEQVLGSRISAGVLVTKHGHSRKPLASFEIIEAGHPIPDKYASIGAEKAIEAVSNLTQEDTVLVLLSGGGSTLFEQSDLSLDELQNINRQLLACGANIQQINTIRKRLSRVKGGRFAALCAPARVVTVMVSDIIGDQLDMIASGPTCVDTSTSREAMKICEQYHLQLSPAALHCLQQETPKHLDRVEYHVCGGVRQLCEAAAQMCQELGYETTILTDCLTCEAREAGAFLGSLARFHAAQGKKVAFIAGGETVVHLTGTGLGGRNQELALAAAPAISGLHHAAVFSIGSDGTDGPTDAAGGYVDGDTETMLHAKGIEIARVLQENDAYHALKACRGLIQTGATGTNVNDLSVVLVG